jgi:hexosaminidase
VPWPRSLEPRDGVFAWHGATRVVAEGDDAVRRVAARLVERLAPALGFRPELAGARAENAVVLRLDPSLHENEGYRLRIDAHGVELLAKTPHGLFYGVQTIVQLLSKQGAGNEARSELPAVEIEDAPRFAYRGLHLDVARHFYPVAVVKRVIEQMARLKLNVFHWHLTEDQGWRIEIKKYPRLTEVGAWRKQTLIGHGHDEPKRYDDVVHGGFYTQEEVRDVVRFAAERFITIVPEIEMPGHALAILAAYPELGCSPGPFEVATSWGIFEDILCPREETFTFLEDVLSEVIELFPGRYVHIGGDEAPKTRWKASEFVQRLKLEQNLHDEDEVQSYFIRRIDRFLTSRGKALVGWDEILEGGLSPNATVMSWRGVSGGIDAARQGHDVIMSPTTHAYFDYYQGPEELEPPGIGGFIPLETVYAFEPVPAELSADQARHVIGAQANLWTEYIKEESHLEYMLFPRLFAMSEVTWTPAGRRDYAAFLRRAEPTALLLEAEGVRVAKRAFGEARPRRAAE